MKKKIISGFILAVTCLTLLVMASCNPLGSGEDEVSRQLVEVTRGDLIIGVTGSGKIEISREARPTFGSAGKLESILVKEGDRVRQDDVLARLDTSALELTLAQAQADLSQAELALTQAQLSERTAEYDLKNTRDSEGALELAVLNAQVSLEQAQRALNTGIAAADHDTAWSRLNRARAWYEYVTEIWPQESPGEIEDWHLALERAEDELEAAQAHYDNVLSGYDSNEIAIKKMQVEAAQMSLDEAQQDLDDLAEDIALRELQLASAHESTLQYERLVELARLSLNDAQRQLDEATIVAPFDGIVAKVLAKEGDNIPSPAMAPQTIIHLIDPTQMELVVEVDEIDIPLVALDQEAVITVDALPDAEFKGTVTAVYPVPVEEGGVVLYEVRLSVEVPENSGIKVGMSASADIVLAEHSNVLLVPSRAIMQNSQGETIVKVMVDEQAEERAVVVGLDDGFRAEIISGLSEGETVVVEVRTKSSTSMGMF